MKIPLGVYKRALKLAEESAYYPFKISAIVFKSNRILSEGKNKVGSCSRVSAKDKFIKNSIHAEADALSKLDNKISKGASLLVLRLNAGTQRLSNSKPCEICQRLIYNKGIKYVYVSNSNGIIEKYKVVRPKKEFKVNNEKTEHGYSDIFIFKLR